MNQSASVGIVTPQKIPFEMPLVLENGKTLPRFDLMIETYGELNAEKNNAVLICHALSGNHHVAADIRRRINMRAGGKIWSVPVNRLIRNVFSWSV